MWEDILKRRDRRRRPDEPFNPFGASKKDMAYSKNQMAKKKIFRTCNKCNTCSQFHEGTQQIGGYGKGSKSSGPTYYSYKRCSNCRKEYKAKEFSTLQPCGSDNGKEIKPICKNKPCLRIANGTDGIGFCMACEDDASGNRLTDPNSPNTRKNQLENPTLPNIYVGEKR
tara:strand:- start:1431 stop:1937 length:507 start_codon:yes stop_codon:yes gene_type:complete